MKIDVPILWKEVKNEIEIDGFKVPYDVCHSGVTKDEAIEQFKGRFTYLASQYGTYTIYCNGVKNTFKGDCHFFKRN